MLESKQKSQAQAEEEKRKMQQEALAKYRQAFASDAEVCLADALLQRVALQDMFASAQRVSVSLI